MASSSTNSTKQSDNQNDKLNQSSDISDESKKVLPTSSTGVEETIEVQQVKIIKQRVTEQQNDLSPHLIRKLAFVPLSAPCISRASLPAELAVRRAGAPVNRARPFEEILVGPATTDLPPGTVTKPDDSN